MSERSASSSQSGGVESIGAYLAKQRRMRGISAEQLADMTRIPLRSIERFEAGHFDADPDGFSRGFVRTVAEALGLDPSETLTRTLQEPEAAGSRAGRGTVAWGRVLLVAALLGFLLGVGALARVGLRVVSKPSIVKHDYVVRRDPVRDLAEAQGSYAPAEQEAPRGPAEASLPLPLAAESTELGLAGIDR